MASDTTERIALLRDDRFWKIAFQVIVLAIVIGLISLFISNMNINLQRAGLELSFDFLTNSASFSIGETPIPYTSSDSYLYAFLVGILNTLRVIIAGFILTTLLGVFAGVASFSDNWLVQKISLVYVEIIRNIPLLLQLIFWYFAVFLNLPAPREQLQLPGSVFMSKAGISIPWPILSPAFWLWIGILIIGGVAALLVLKWRTKLMVEQSQSGQTQLMIVTGIAIATLIIVVFGFNWEFPTSPDEGLVSGGLNLSLEYASLLTGLVVYTAAFIAEIVRGGIQSVSRGQWEAARSLGLKSGLVMRLVVLPQALRVIIPPLSSQYMNLAKNSSLALAIGYPDLYSVNQTIFNQTGRPVEAFILLMCTYLFISLTISLVMNQFNRMVQIQER
ncbi:MAG: ABC transporter permease subunit [Leptolyngbyaceae bacterium]|nr:ABC transporter permease subunit [Leptolyngbyaceae bacterium]